MAAPKTGFVVPVRTAEITFEGTDYDGAVIECLLDLPLDWFFEVQRAGTGGDSEENEKMVTEWADKCLIAWNLTEEDGTPIPCDRAHFMAQPTAFTTTIVQEWQRRRPLRLPLYRGNREMEICRGRLRRRNRQVHNQACGACRG